MRLEAFSCHFNISYELPRDERNRNRTIQKLALLLAHLLPVPVIVAGANRRSTGLGVRPRRDRIEITLDFTPDPGSWPPPRRSSSASCARSSPGRRTASRSCAARGIPVVDGVTPGNTPRATAGSSRDFHFPRNPFTTADRRAGVEADRRTHALDARHRPGDAAYFAGSIRRWSDPFSYRDPLLGPGGETPSLLDLADRPPAYRRRRPRGALGHDPAGAAQLQGAMSDEDPAEPRRRRADVEENSARRGAAKAATAASASRSPPAWSAANAGTPRRDHPLPPPRASPAPRTRRSSASSPAASGCRSGAELLTPVAVKGWYHAVFRNEARRGAAAVDRRGAASTWTGGGSNTVIPRSQAFTTGPSQGGRRTMLPPATLTSAPSVPRCLG